MKARGYNLPKMPDCTSCGECCGPVAATPREASARAEYVASNGVEWVDDPEDALRCGFYSEGRCKIYPARPFACRAYGVVVEMPCAFFPLSAVQSLPADEAVSRGLMNPDSDKLLAAHFAPDKGVAMWKAVLANGSMDRTKHRRAPVG